MEKILVVNMNWLGDVVFSSPIFSALKKRYPKAHLACLAVPRVKGILECIPGIDEIIVYDEEGKHWNPLAKLKLIFQLRKQKFDSAFLLHRSLTRALLVYSAGIPIRVGYDEKGRGRFLTHKVQKLNDNAHRSDCYLNVIESYGVPVSDRHCRLTVSGKVDRSVEQVLSANNLEGDDYVILIHPGGNWDLKRWPKENFSSLIARLLEKQNVKVIISGSDNDASLVEEIVAPLKKKPIVLVGVLSLSQLMAVMKKVSLVISADSGPLHLACGVACESIALFGPTRPEVTGPRGEGDARILQHDVGCNRNPCYNLKCLDNICMQSITVDDVFEIIQKIHN